MKRRLLFAGFILFFCCPIISLAQKGRMVAGKITDTTHNPLPGITVKLFIPGSKDSLHTLSDKKGLYSFFPVTSSRFIISISSSEFGEYVHEFSFSETEKAMLIGEIILHPDFKVLKEVKISLPFMTIREDTIEYKADSILLRADASVEDLLKKLPGIQVNKNGEITAQGRPVYKIKVNGKDFFGSDVKMATRELPANVVDKIQVIDDYGEEVAHTGIKSGDPVKVINLKLKKDKSNGVFGNAGAGYGSSESYQAKASMSFFSDRSQLSLYGNSNNINNGLVITNTGKDGLNLMMLPGQNISSGGTGSGNTGIRGNINGIPDGITTTHSAGTNFRFDFGKKNSMYGSYSYGKRKTEGFREIYQQNFYPTGNFINNQRYDFKNMGSNHNLYLNLELYPDSMNYLKISPEFSINDNKGNSSNQFSYIRDSIFKTSEGYLNDTSKSNRPAIGVNIYYNHSFRKKGRNLNLSLSLGTNHSNMETNRPGFTRVYDTQGSYRDSTQDQHINEENKGNNYNLYFAFTEPIAKNKYADITWSHDFSRSSTDRNVFLLRSGTNNFILDSGLSNQYTNRFTNDRIGINFRTVKKKYNYTLGISLLPVNTKTYSDEKDTINTKQHFINISPSAQFSYTFSKARNITISYQGMNRQPVSLLLQPVRDISNPQFQREGNPGLKPEFRHTAGLSYNSFNLTGGSSIFSSLNFNIVHNKIVNNTILLDSGGAQLNRPENINGAYNIAGFYSYSQPLQKNKYNLRLNGSFFYSHDAILVNHVRTTGNNWMLVQGIRFTYANNKWLEFGMEANYSVSATRNLLNHSNNFTYSTWTIGNNATLYLPANIIIRYDFERLFNNGLAGSFDKDINLLNLSAEKKLLRKKSIYLTLSAYNILDQSSSVSREVTGNSITDARYLQLSRYYLFTLQYRWNKFGGQKNSRK